MVRFCISTRSRNRSLASWSSSPGRLNASMLDMATSRGLRTQDHEGPGPDIALGVSGAPANLIIPAIDAAGKISVDRPPPHLGRTDAPVGGRIGGKRHVGPDLHTAGLDADAGRDDRTVVAAEQTALAGRMLGHITPAQRHHCLRVSSTFPAANM